MANNAQTTLEPNCLLEIAGLHQHGGSLNRNAVRIELCDRTGVWLGELKKFYQSTQGVLAADRCLQIVDANSGAFWRDVSDSIASADLCVIFPGQLSNSQAEIFNKKFCDILNKEAAKFAPEERPEICIVLSDSQDSLVSSLRQTLTTYDKQFNLRLEVVPTLSGKAAWNAISHPYSASNARPETGTVIEIPTLINLNKQQHCAVTNPNVSLSQNSESPTQGLTLMANLKDSLDQIMTIDGAIAVGLVDYNSGMLLGKAGSTALNLDVAAAGNSEVLKAKQKTMKSLGLNDVIEDMLITLGTQYHLIRLLPSKPGLFLYFALDKSKANLAMARYKLAEIEKIVTV